MRLEEWMRAKGWKYHELAAALGIKIEPARRLCLPPSDRLRRRPKVELLVKIEQLTEGQVKAADFVYDASDAAA